MMILCVCVLQKYPNELVAFFLILVLLFFGWCSLLTVDDSVPSEMYVNMWPDFITP